MPSSKIFYLKFRLPTRNSDADSKIKFIKKFKIKVFSWCLKKHFPNLGTYICIHSVWKDRVI